MGGWEGGLGERVEIEGLRDYVGACVGAGKGKGQSEICNALLNLGVYSCNVSCIVL